MPLDPEIAAHLERQKSQPPRSSLDITATREMMRRGAALAGTPPPLPRVEDLELHSMVRARQYWPSVDATLPIVIYFHGGRFFSGDLESHDTVCRLLALSSGCRIVAVDYRLAPEHRFSAALQDACSAVEWAMHQDVRIGVAGDSAGANLAAGVALLHPAPRLRCQLLIYPMIDATSSSPSYTQFAEGYGPGAADMRRGWSEYLPAGVDPRHPAASPIFAEVPRGVAPAFVLTAEYDTLRDEGEAYAQKLVRAGAEVQLRRYAGAIHGFFTMPGILCLAREAIDDAGRFLRDTLVNSID
ncbi:MAG: Alpha/beta hydrolase fold-3 domain protein [Candidatus Solibacter sp.]|nr:Alpha/beta hydrolase fold-3 domain protein [Candidatus Solibacter sp.]